MSASALRTVLPWRDATTGRPKQPLLNHRLLATSLGSPWRGLDVEWGYTVDEWEPENMISASHLISISDTSAAYIEQRTDTGYVRHRLAQHTVWICPAGHLFGFRLPGDHWWGTVAVSPARVRSLFGERYELRSVCGLPDRVLHDIVSAILAKIRSGDGCSDLFAESLITALISQLIENEDCRRELSADQVLSPEQLRAVFGYVAARLTAPLSVADMAAAAGLSEPYFARVFKRQLGQAPLQYVILERLKRAQFLIAAGHSLTDVAANCGFSDQAHMTRRFVQHIGLTPGAYRQQLHRETQRKANGGACERELRCLE